jgi:hypothetical protein
MSEPEDSEGSSENFLQRWSRRKHADSHPHANAPETPPQVRSEAATPERPPAHHPALGDADRLGFDPTSLPPLDSIDAATDIRAFLAPGVPEEFTRAALRRAWVTDPTIRDFIGLAENQWDFTNPEGVPGFGPLEMTAELRRMVGRLVGGAPEPTAAGSQAQVEPTAQIAGNSNETALRASVAGRGEIECDADPFRPQPNLKAEEVAPATSVPALSQGESGDTAVQKRSGDANPDRQPAHRRHGAALPK